MLNLAETYAPLVAVDRRAARRGRRRVARRSASLAPQDGTFFAACNYYAYVATRAA